MFGWPETRCQLLSGALCEFRRYPVSLSVDGRTDVVRDLQRKQAEPHAAIKGCGAVPEVAICPPKSNMVPTGRADDFVDLESHVLLLILEVERADWRCGVRAVEYHAFCDANGGLQGNWIGLCPPRPVQRALDPILRSKNL